MLKGNLLRIITSQFAKRTIGKLLKIFSSNFYKRNWYLSQRWIETIAHTYASQFMPQLKMSCRLTSGSVTLNFTILDFVFVIFTKTAHKFSFLPECSLPIKLLNLFRISLIEIQLDSHLFVLVWFMLLTTILKQTSSSLKIISV